MIHKDGIEVDLKPMGPDSDNVRFAEFPLAEVETKGWSDDDQHKRCAVLARPGAFKIVVRITEDFLMYSANCLLISVRSESAPATQECWSNWVIQRTLVHGQHIITKNYWRTQDISSESPLQMESWAEALDGKLDKLGPESLETGIRQQGTVSVAVTRCNALWEEHDPLGVSVTRSLFGTEHPSTKRTYVQDSLKPSNSGSMNRKRYCFEFRYRSQDFVSRMRNPRLGVRRQHEIMPDSALHTVKDVEFVKTRERKRLNLELQKLNDNDREHEQNGNGSFKQDIVAQSRDDAIESTSAAIERTLPRFCECTKATREPPRGKRRCSESIPKPKAPGVVGLVSIGLWTDDKVKGVEPQDDSDVIGEPVVASVCIYCHNYEVQKDLRSGFLRIWNADHPAFRKPSGQDIGHPMITASSTQDPPEGSKNRQPPLAASDLGAPPDVQRRQQGSGSGGTQSNANELVAAPSSGEERPLHQASDREKISSTELQVADHNAESTPSQSVPVVVPNEKNVQDMAQPEITGADEATEPDVNKTPLVRQRSTEALVDSRPSKQQRTSIDLADLHKETTVKVKKEHTESNEMVTLASSEEDEEDDDLQAKLDNIDREIRIERLEKQRAEILQKQKLKRRSSAGKQTDAVKIKKEVIEIEDD